MHILAHVKRLGSDVQLNICGATGLPYIKTIVTSGVFLKMEVGIRKGA